MHCAIAKCPALTACIFTSGFFADSCLWRLSVLALLHLMKLLDRMGSEHRLHGLILAPVGVDGAESQVMPRVCYSAHVHSALLSLFLLPHLCFSLLTGSLWFFFFSTVPAMSDKHWKGWSVKNDRIRDSYASVKASAPVGVYHKLAAALLLIQTKEQGALCTLFKFPILPTEQFVSDFEVLKTELAHDPVSLIILLSNPCSHL